MRLPAFDYETSRDSLGRLHLITQLLGSAARSISLDDDGDWLFGLNARGVSSPLLPGGIDMRLDLLQREIRLASVRGKVATVSITGTPLSELRSQLLDGLDYLGLKKQPYLPEMEDSGEPENFKEVLRAVLVVWAGTQEVLGRLLRRFKGPHTGVKLDWTTMNLGVTVYNGREADASRGMGDLTDESLGREQCYCGVSLGDEMTPEATFYSWIHPAVESPEGQLRPSGATFREDRRQAQLVYRALAPRSDWPTALGWFFESAFESQARAADWDLRSLWRGAERDREV